MHKRTISFCTHPTPLYSTYNVRYLTHHNFHTKNLLSNFSDSTRLFHTNTTLRQQKEHRHHDTDALRLEWSRVARGSSRLPKELENIVEDIVHSIPKRALRQTAKVLSDTLRLRLHHPKSSEQHDKKQDKEKQNTSSDTLWTDYTDDDGNERPYSRREQRRQSAAKAAERREREMQQLRMNTHSRIRHRDDIRVVYGRDQAVAYAAHRMPAIYAAVRRVLTETSRRLPGYNPQTHLDFGAGTGTSVWAVSEVFPSVEDVVCVEPSSGMMDVGMEVVDHVRPRVAWRRFLHDNTTRRHDLVTATYVLNELQEEEEMVQTVRRLWSVTDGVLVLLEPGTPAGFTNILTARSTLLAMSPRPQILAPCPHSGRCPMQDEPRDSRWCHFAQRVERSTFQRTAKTGIKLGYEDEKFSYLTVCREDMLRAWQQAPGEDEPGSGILDGELARSATKERWGRLVSPPGRRGRHVHLDLCNGDGELEHRVVTKGKAQEKGEYRAARKVFWGDVYPYSSTTFK